MTDNELVLTFDAEGAGHCLYGELFDLRALGPIECRRASHIEFEPTTQRWHVLSPDRATTLFSHRSRKGCERWERSHLQPE